MALRGPRRMKVSPPRRQVVALRGVGGPPPAANDALRGRRRLASRPLCRMGRIPTHPAQRSGRRRDWPLFRPPRAVMVSDLWEIDAWATLEDVRTTLFGASGRSHRRLRWKRTGEPPA